MQEHKGVFIKKKTVVSTYEFLRKKKAVKLCTKLFLIEINLKFFQKKTSVYTSKISENYMFYKISKLYI